MATAEIAQGCQESWNHFGKDEETQHPLVFYVWGPRVLAIQNQRETLYFMTCKVPWIFSLAATKTKQYEYECFDSSNL